jgi:hypothetical protein
MSFEQTFHGDLLAVLCGMLEPSGVLALSSISTWYNKNIDLKLYIKSMLPASVKYHVMYPDCISDWGSAESSYYGCSRQSFGECRYYSGKKHDGECVYVHNLIQACKHASWAECKFQMKRALSIQILAKYTRSILHMLTDEYALDDTLLTKIYGVLVEIYLNSDQFSVIHMFEIRKMENILLKTICKAQCVVIEK